MKRKPDNERNIEDTAGGYFGNSSDFIPPFMGLIGSKAAYDKAFQSKIKPIGSVPIIDSNRVKIEISPSPSPSPSEHEPYTGSKNPLKGQTYDKKGKK